MNGSELFLLAEQTAPYAVALRHELHQHPELALREFETTQIIRRELDQMGVEYQQIGMDTGCVALIHGAKSGKGSTIAIRADIDALPVEDLCGQLYASKNQGVSHACGHDAHTACLLGTARLLTALRDQFSGTVKLIFQPGEEGLKGAQLMVDSRVLENPHVDSMIALHCTPAFPVGMVALAKGKIMASSDMFTIRFTGKSAHAGRPAEGINSLLAACHAVIALQTIVAGEVNTKEEAVVSTCILHAGTAHNIIPQEAVIQGTVRCLGRDVRRQLEQSVHRVADSAAQMCRCTCNIDYVHGIPALSNDDETTDVLFASAVKAVGAEHVVPLPTVLGSEDFAVYTEYLKHTCYYRLGCADRPLSEQPLLHNAQFNFADGAMPYGIAVHAAYVLQVNGELN